MKKKRIADDLADAYIPRTVDLMRYSESVRLQVLGFLNELEEDLTRALVEVDPGDAIGDPERFKRREALIRQTSSTITTAYSDIDEAHAQEMLDLTKEQARFGVSTLNKTIGVDVASINLTPGFLKTIASETLIQGAPSRDWWKKQSADLRQSFASQVRIGISAGETTGDIVRRIRGKATGARTYITDRKGKRKVIPKFAGGIMDASTRNATALVRSSVMAVANETDAKVYKANKDIIKGVQALTTLDGRTTLICIGRSGGAWDNEGKPLPESKVRTRFPGNPPWHWNCRSKLIPVMRSFSEISGIRGLPEFPPSTRASMDGQVAEDLDYETWLKGKDAAFAKEVLGPGRYKLWTSGKIKLNELIDPRGRPLTIAELSRR